MGETRAKNTYAQFENNVLTYSSSRYETETDRKVLLTGKCGIQQCNNRIERGVYEGRRPWAYSPFWWRDILSKNIYWDTTKQWIRSF
jgi:hypothetical protein